MASFWSRLMMYVLLFFMWIGTAFAAGRIRRDLITKSMVLGFVYNGAPIKLVASIFGIRSVRTILRWKQKFETYGTIDYEPKRGGRRYKIHNYHVDIIVELLRGKPSMYIGEIQKKLYRRTGDLFPIVTIWRKCRKHRLTKKVLSRRFTEANPFAELTFWHCLRTYMINTDMLIWVDEAYICATTGNRTRGWSLRHVYTSNVL